MGNIWCWLGVKLIMLFNKTAKKVSCALIIVSAIGFISNLLWILISVIGEVNYGNFILAFVLFWVAGFLFLISLIISILFLVNNEIWKSKKIYLSLLIIDAVFIISVLVFFWIYYLINYIKNKDSVSEAGNKKNIIDVK